MLDPTIKLFGKRIQVNGEDEESHPHDYEFNNNESSNSDDLHEVEDTKEVADEESMDISEPEDQSGVAKEETSPAMSETDDQNRKPNDSDKEAEAETETETEKDEKESNDAKNSQQKQLKKPDKILPCPRCNSMDTKFCYYNNYNVNQPRHFCKSCQRYWTAGGTMRNVPVGAGRRKNKSSASRYCHITVSEALQAARLDVTNGMHLPGLKTNGTVLTFGSDNPLCDSMASVLSIADKKILNGTPRNGFHNIDHVVPVPTRGLENGDDRSSGSTVTTNSMDDQSKKGAQEPKQHFNGYTNQMPCFQWPYMWNPAVPVPPGFCPSAFPMPMYPPPPYWNGTAMPWNVPWVTQCSPTQNSPRSNPNSPTLGKHSRDGEMITQSDNDRSSGTATTTGTASSTTVLVPKTLRIDDPDEAAKSSIWTTLGIKKDKADSTGRGFFNSFPSKEAEKTDRDVGSSPALKANPAALSRSMSFQERA